MMILIPKPKMAEAIGIQPLLLRGPAFVDFALRLFW